MPLMRGGTVADRVASHGQWPLPAAALLVEQVGGALAAAHRAGTLHRDVKPSNILLDGQGNAYLGDFGLAVRATGATRPIEARGAVGAHPYAAPEQLDGSAVGTGADIYGLAVTTWELLAGSHPNSFRRIDAALVSDRPTALPSLQIARHDLPAQLDVVLRRATHPAPAQRYASAREFVDAFVTAAGGRHNPHPAASGARSRRCGHRRVTSSTRSRV